MTGVTPVFDVPAGVPGPPVLAAASYVLADLDTGDVLVAKAPHGRAMPASTLKTLTALTVIPMLDPAQFYTAVPQDIVDGSKVGMAPGSSYTVQQLLQGMMLPSGNDAATALARAAGGLPQIVARMQQTARDLGAYDTVVKDPSGLDAPGQVTSAYDLALIARAALQLPGFRALVTTKRVRFPGKNVPGKPRVSYEIQNHNSLLFNYPGAIGVKNGYTVAARWTIVAAATRGGRTYAVTALTRTDRSWRPTAALLDWAFAHGQQASPIGRLVSPGEPAPVTPSPSATAPVTLSASPVPSLPTANGSTADTADTGGQGGAGAGGSGPLAVSASAPDARVRTWVGAGGLSAAALMLVVLGLSARARRRQVLAARAARSARRSPR